MNPSTALATVLVDELVRLGCRHAVLAPGSRSAPLAYALVEADSAGRLELHVRVDERSAAFVALGLARGSGTPVPVVCTSGTAVANLHPAVLEASASGVPLLLLTADRPPELRGTGANQTTDQVKIFGSAVRWAHDLGAPDRDGSPAVVASQQGAWRTSLDRAWSAALGTLGGAPGPVHLNVPFRDPLAPELPPAEVPPAGVAPEGVAPEGVAPWAGPSAAGRAGSFPVEIAGRSDGGPWTQVTPLTGGVSCLDPHPHSDDVQGAVDDIPRTLLVLGDTGSSARAAQALDIAARLGWPVLAEPFGPRPPGSALPHGPLLAATDLASRRPPDRVLVVGRLTLTRAVAALLRQAACVEVVTSAATWADPSHGAARVHPWAALAERGRVGRGSRRTDADTAWASAWHEAGESLGAAVRPLLGWPAEGSPTGPAVASVLLGALPQGACLFLGSSNGVRDVDLARTGDGVDILANRGLAGIDGCLSTAVGLALSSKQPTYALVGDLTFLHDGNALLIGHLERAPDLTIVVVNDGGGGIFSTLEYGEPGRGGRTFERVFGTPTGTRLADLCAAHRVAHEQVRTADDLADQVGRAPQGLRVVEVCLDRSRHRDTYAALRAAALKGTADPR